MNLQEFNSQSKTTKPWLKIVCNTIDSNKSSSTEVETPLLTLDNVAGVPNPPVGSIAVYSDNTGALSSRDSTGTVVTYTTSAIFADALLQQGPTVGRNLPMYVDNVSLNVEDSGISADQLITNTLGLANVISQSTPIAPNGQRDLWQYGTGAVNGGGVVYLKEIDVVIAGGQIGSNDLDYSIDGGVTFNPCIFDVPSTSAFTFGWNGSVATAINASFSYTSTDGINWTQGAALPTATYESFNMEWFSGANLFVTGVNVSPTQRMMTSPDGINWTIQNSSIEALTVKSNNNICVAVGSQSPFFQYSVDGVNWINTLSAVNYARALCWAEAKNQFFAIGAATGNGFISSDGITWSPLGVVFPNGFGPNDTLIFVDGPDINFRYYASRNDAATNNYSLFSTPDAQLPFLGTSLDGSLINPLSYSLVYLESRNRFVMGVNNAPFVAYSTPRKTDIKAISDNIRVRGNPVHVDQYSTYADVLLDNTAVETNISTSASSIGSLVYQAAQPLGMKINLDLNLVVSSVAGDTLTIRVKNNGGLLYSHTLTVPALSVSLPININSKIIIRNGTIQLNSTQIISGIVDMITSSAIVFNRAIANTISVTGQWGLAASQCTMNSLTIDNMFRNGA